MSVFLWLFARIVLVCPAVLVELCEEGECKNDGDNDDDSNFVQVRSTKALHKERVDIAVPATAEAKDQEFVEIRIGVGGDIMYVSKLMQIAFSSNETYNAVWKELRPMFRPPFVDMFYLNHETPTASNTDNMWHDAADPGLVAGDVYQAKGNEFNNNKMLDHDLVDLFGGSSRGVVSLVNNHCLDRGPKGLNQTIQSLDEVGLRHFGTRTDATVDWDTEGAGYAVIEKDGIKVAWTGCTHHVHLDYHSNLKRRLKKLFPGSHPRDQVLYCDMHLEPGKNPFLHLVRQLSTQYDAVVATAHFGDLYSPEVSPDQERFAEQILDSGAVSVIGAHPHVLQRWSTTARPGKLVIYSAGNLLSGGGKTRLTRCIDLTSKYAKKGLVSRGLTKEECEASLNSTAIFYFGLQVPKPSSQGASRNATATCVSYVETQWQDTEDRQGMFLRDPDPSSMALHLYGPRHRVSVSNSSFDEKVRCIPIDGAGKADS